MSEAAGQAPRSDLPIRFAAGVVMIAVALAALYLRGIPFLILVSAAAAIMFIEWADIHKASRSWAAAGAALLVFNLWLVPTLAPPSTPELNQYWLWFGSAVFLAVLVGLALRSLNVGWGYAYVAIPSLSLLFLIALGWQPVLWAMLVTWSTDIFAYFAGRTIGGPKLAPRISPNKTWAGLAGGGIGAAIVGIVAAQLLSLPAAFHWAGGMMALIAQGGDLYESAAKRRAGVKDSGTILPGHGGVLDRLDGLLPVAVATLFLTMASA